MLGGVHGGRTCCKSTDRWLRGQLTGLLGPFLVLALIIAGQLVVVLCQVLLELRAGDLAVLAPTLCSRVVDVTTVPTTFKLGIWAVARG